MMSSVGELALQLLIVTGGSGGGGGGEGQGVAIEVSQRLESVSAVTQPGRTASTAPWTVNVNTHAHT